MVATSFAPLFASVISIVVPAGVWRIALSRRFASISVSKSRSPQHQRSGLDFGAQPFALLFRGGRICLGDSLECRAEIELPEACVPGARFNLRNPEKGGERIEDRVGLADRCVDRVFQLRIMPRSALSQFRVSGEDGSGVSGEHGRCRWTPDSSSPSNPGSDRAFD